MLLQWIAIFLGKISGWKVVGPTPQAQKYVIIGAPHSSNWDFWAAMFTKFSRRMPVNFLAKKVLFRPLWGWFFRMLGGLPVDRNKSQNLVQAAIEAAKREKQFCLAIAPEGTRTAGRSFKTGFYHIALGAKLPLYLAGVDLANKTVHLSEEVPLSGNQEEDFKRILAFFAPFTGKNGQKVVIPNMQDG